MKLLILAPQSFLPFLEHGATKVSAPAKELGVLLGLSPQPSTFQLSQSSAIITQPLRCQPHGGSFSSTVISVCGLPLQPHSTPAWLMLVSAEVPP